MTAPLFEITKSAGFDAAHRLPAGPQDGPYTRLHGHSFKVEAALKGPATAPVGWVEDLARLDVALKAAAAELDHSLLNDHAGLESPTLEALCVYFAGRLGGEFPGPEPGGGVPTDRRRKLRLGSGVPLRVLQRIDQHHLGVLQSPHFQHGLVGDRRAITGLQRPPLTSISPVAAAR